MIERSSATPLEMTPGCYRIPDGHVVPNPPHPAPQPAPTGYDCRLRRTVLACLVVVALGVLIGVLR
ncbi:hypothetical protein [Micromonospora sp. CB01531]|uniref:hypothetical protein n=1 Tax=Micromonospora sp. CB01531 TaxID=1718947 RepID=UPI000939D853|nr:hypothetical protein [Micromonospora sp. CB01531]OKI47323.1 hypothetical protein A6A27_10775 [Micromonospora sp. CB01531]